MKIKKGGVKWIVKSREEWQQQTKLSRNQVDRALKKLREAGLINTCKGHFKGWKTLLHIRLTPTAVTMLMIGQISPEPEGPSNAGSLESEKTGSLKSEKTYSQKLTTQKHTKKTPSESPSSEAAASLKPEPGKMKVNDIILSSPKGTKGHLNAGAREASLGKLWKQLHVEFYHGKAFVPAFTNKQLAQLKQFAEKCKPHDPKMVMTQCLQYWVEYCTTCETAEGIDYSPDKPSIGWLLKYAGVAVNFALEKTKPKKTGIISQPNKPKSAPVQSIATPEELAAKAAAAEAEHQEILKLLSDADE